MELRTKDTNEIIIKLSIRRYHNLIDSLQQFIARNKIEKLKIDRTSDTDVYYIYNGSFDDAEKLIQTLRNVFYTERDLEELKLEAIKLL